MLRKDSPSRPPLLAALSYFLISLLCTQVPLLNYLGYEFSAVIALLASFTSGLLTISAVKRAVHDDQNPEFPLQQYTLASFKKALLLNLMLLLVPLTVMSANAVFVKNCSLLEGFGFFTLLPVVSVIFSSSLGFFCAVHYRRAKMMFILFVFATFVEVVAVGYFTPAIFSYNFFYGYFPGLTYDEALGIRWSLILFRLLTLILAAALVWMAQLVLDSTERSATAWEKGTTLLGVMVQGRNVFITGALATLIVVVWWFRGELGFDSSSRYIQHTLGRLYTSPHVRIYYSSESYTDDEIRWVAAEHEFRLKQISTELHLPFAGSVESYIYPSAEVKQRLIGAGTTNIAKPWSGQIHITQQALDATLKHELVHVLAAPFGLPIIKASLSTGVVEGLAMAIEWDWGNRTLHQYAAAMKRFGVGPDISAIMSFTGFAAHASSISYVLAGSFCRFLMDTYGIRRLMLLYRSNDYQKIYEKSLQELIKEWRGFLQSVPVGDEDRDAVDVLFRRPPIFQKVCARVIAGRNKRAAQAFTQRDYRAASALYRESFDEGRGYEALSGFLASALYARDFATVVAMYDTVISRSDNPAQYLPLFITAGLAHWGLGDLRTAERLFDRVRRADISEPLTETAYICIAALQDSVVRSAVFRYFTTASTDSERIALLDAMLRDPTHPPLPLYLKGKILMRMKRWSEAYDALQRLRMPQPLLEALRLKAIGVALFRLQRFDEAKMHFWRSLNFSDTEVARNDVNEWIERCDWVRAYFARTGR